MGPAQNELYWLCQADSWTNDVKAVDELTGLAAWQKLKGLANTRLDLARTERLDRLIARLFGTEPPKGLQPKPIRLALLGSCTLDHLVSGIRVGCLRRNIWTATYVGPYGQYRQELLDKSSGLHAFSPDVILFAFDACHLTGDLSRASDQAEADKILAQQVEQILELWEIARTHFGAHIIQQSVLPTIPGLIGNNEDRLFTSPRQFVDRVNAKLRVEANSRGADMLDLDTRVKENGLYAWHDLSLWHRGKFDIYPGSAPFYGDLVARLVASRQGLSAKCLAIDLDNTIWGGVIGDDGVNGIVLGQGSAVGESFIEFQKYIKMLGRRGIILAVCSKNDHANAIEAFESHPEMILRLNDIACFVANWDDKVANLRRIAEQLNIGLDSIVFVDDSPFERNVVRRELPMVAVPELPEDPAWYSRAIADAGYFEAVEITKEDLRRGEMYRANADREALKVAATNLEGYLASLEMKLEYKPFDKTNLQRIVQLINKTNQFNLTTKRYTQDEVEGLIAAPDAVTLQLRLLDRFGDNGIIAIIIARYVDSQSAVLDTWLMSCRVLGRQVEQASLHALVQEALRRRLTHLRGAFRPTKKNAIVRDHYEKLGFRRENDCDDGQTTWVLDLKEYSPPRTSIQVLEPSREL